MEDIRRAMEAAGVDPEKVARVERDLHALPADVVDEERPPGRGVWKAKGNPDRRTMTERLRLEGQYKPSAREVFVDRVFGIGTAADPGTTDEGGQS